jgi:hypothetical protein
MSNTRYIEVCSSYRDRNRWPLPSEFEMPIGQSGTRGKLDAIDPVSNATPMAKWQVDRFDTTNTTIVGPTPITFTVSPNTNSITNSSGRLVVMATADNPQRAENYYSKVVAIVDATSPGANERRRVETYVYLDKGLAEFTFDLPFSTEITSFKLEDPTSTGTTGTVADPKVFFVPSGLEGRNAYNNKFLYNETDGSSFLIDDYSEHTHLLTLNDSTVDTTNWAGNVLSIRKELPLLYGKFDFTVPGSTESRTSFILPPTNNLTDLTGDFLERINIDSVQSESRRISKYVNVTGTLVSVTGSQIVLDINASNTESYTGLYIRIALATPNYVLVTAYDQTTRTATVTSFTGAAAGDAYSIRSGLVSPPFSTPISTVPADDEYYTIMQFTRDNMNPFTYTGSTLSQQEMVCYEVSLVDLILPNIILDASVGARIAFYPYVYVEMTNVSAAGAGVINTIYSNNPNSRRMLFRVPISDIRNPLISPFIKINSSMTQTIKFKPNDNLKFAVYFPDGEVFKTLQTDSYSPHNPNFLVQISALFSIKRL